MELTTRTWNNSIFEIEIESGNAFIKDDISIRNVKKKTYEVDNNVYESFITAAAEMSRFNNKTDVEFVKDIFDNFLNDHEREEFLELIK